MSLVGPRPERPQFVDMLSQEIRYYGIRHSVKPGLTGWAQVNGLRGETETLDKMEARIRYDLDYLVTESDLPLPVAYRNQQFRIYALR